MSGEETSGGGLTLGERIRKIEDDSAATRAIVSEINGRGRADLVRFEHLERDLADKADAGAVGRLSERVSGLEGSITWAWRTAGGALLVGLVGLLLDRI